MFKAMTAKQLHKQLGAMIERSLGHPGTDVNMDAPIVLTVGSDPESPDYDEFTIYSAGGSEDFEGVVLGITTDLDL